jgi:uncharacterized membrane protein YjgN (DUF898 family)
MTDVPHSPAAFAAEPDPTTPPPAQPQQEVRSIPFRFTGTAGEYFRIWIVNTFLSVITYGIYSAWAKVRNKQFFYRHTYLEDASFEYLANPINILKGRILIAAVLVLVSVSQHYSPVLYLLLILGLIAATPWVIVKALSFNAKNSAWRNVRLSFRGSVGDSYLAYFLGVLVYVFTCGLGMPFMQWKISEFAITNHRWGTLSFRWRTDVGQYFLAFVIAFGISLPIVMAYVGGMFAFIFAGGGPGGSDKPPAAMMIIVFALYALLIVPEAYLKAKIANLMWGGITVGPHELESNQQWSEVLFIQVTNILAIICTLGLATPWAKVRSYRYRLDHLRVNAHGPLVVASGRGPEDVGAFGDAATDLGDFDMDFG